MCTRNIHVAALMQQIATIAMLLLLPALLMLENMCLYLLHAQLSFTLLHSSTEYCMTMFVLLPVPIKSNANKIQFPIYIGDPRNWKWPVGTWRSWYMALGSRCFSRGITQNFRCSKKTGCNRNVVMSIYYFLKSCIGCIGL